MRDLVFFSSFGLSLLRQAIIMGSTQLWENEKHIFRRFCDVENCDTLWCEDLYSNFTQKYMMRITYLVLRVFLRLED